MDKSNPPEMHLMMVLSTGHLTEKDAALLTSDAAKFPFSIWENEYGYVVSVVDAGDDDVLSTESPSLDRCLKYARDAGVRYLMFDRDADCREDLPVYDW